MNSYLHLIELLAIINLGIGNFASIRAQLISNLFANHLYSRLKALNMSETFSGNKRSIDEIDNIFAVLNNQINKTGDKYTSLFNTTGIYCVLILMLSSLREVINFDLHFAIYTFNFLIAAYYLLGIVSNIISTEKYPLAKVFRGWIVFLAFCLIVPSIENPIFFPYHLSDILSHPGKNIGLYNQILSFAIQIVPFLYFFIRIKIIVLHQQRIIKHLTRNNEKDIFSRIEKINTKRTDPDEDNDTDITGPMKK